MRYSLSWLSDYVTITDTPETLATSLCLAGFEIDKITRHGENLKNILTGQVRNVTPHPQADRLVITDVSTGDESDLHRIVTGAAVAVGDIIPVSLPGSVLANGHVIKAQVLRGEPSDGMLCAASELGVSFPDSSPQATGLWQLPKDTPLGIDFIAYANLNDTCFDITILPNRGDAMSMIGLAREIAAITQQPLTYPDKTPAIKLDKKNLIHTDTCHSYALVQFDAIHVTESPFWLQRRLQLCNINPVNNIVDITNYVMLEYGQPLHAFGQGDSNAFTVRQAQAHDSVVLLDATDNQATTLTNADCVICHGDTPVALAGIMGGDSHRVTAASQRIILEAAHFSATAIRRTAKRVGRRTDSAIRFEKYSDPELYQHALSRASHLIQHHQPQAVLSQGYYDSATTYAPRHIQFESTKINRLLGLDLSESISLDYLNRLGFTAQNKHISVPSWRYYDCYNLADLAEEILRLHGINRLPDAQLSIRTPVQPDPTHQARTIIDRLVHQGFTEVVTIPLVSPDECHAIGWENPLITLQNPLSQTDSVLQPHGLPGLLRVVNHNYNRQVRHMRLTGCTPIFSRASDHYAETTVCHGILLDASDNRSLNFWDLKRTLLSIDDRFIFEQAQMPWFHPGQAARLSGPTTGECGMLHPKFNLNAYYWAIHLPVATRDYQAVPLSKYPAINRDISLIIPKSMAYQTVIDAFPQTIADIKQIHLFDYFESDKLLGKNHKALGLCITYQSDKKTLSDTKVNKLHQHVIKQVLKKLPDATVRT